MREGDRGVRREVGCVRRDRGVRRGGVCEERGGMCEERGGVCEREMCEERSMGYERERGSLVPRPSTPPVFDRLQYAKTEGEGPGNFIT